MLTLASSSKLRIVLYFPRHPGLAKALASNKIRFINRKKIEPPPSCSLKSYTAFSWSKSQHLTHGSCVLLGKKKKVKFHLKAEGVLSIRAICVYDTSVVAAGGEFKEYLPCPSRIRMISLFGFVVWLSQMSVTCDMNLRSSLSKWSTTQNSPVPAFDLFTFPGWRTGRLTRVTLFTGASWELVGDERSMQMSSFNQSPSCLQLWARSNLLAQELPSLRMVKDSYMAHPPSPSLCLALMIPICRSRMFFLEGGGQTKLWRI